MKRHPDQYCFYTYRDVDGAQERLYNVTDGPSAEFITHGETGKRANRVESSRQYAPTHVPQVGDRILIRATEQTLRAYAAKLVKMRIDRWGLTEMQQRFASQDAAEADALEFLGKKAVEIVTANTGLIDALMKQREDDAAEVTLVDAGLLLHRPGPLALEAKELVKAFAKVAEAVFGTPVSVQELKRNLDFYDRDCKRIDVERYCKLLDMESYRRIAWHRVTEKLIVSTIWLGIDLSAANDVTPRIFESKLIGDTEPIAAKLWATEKEAKAGHYSMVNSITELVRKTSGKKAAGGQN